MYIEIVKLTIIFIIGISLYFFVYISLNTVFSKFKAKKRLKFYRQKEQTKRTKAKITEKSKALRHLYLLLAALDFPVSLGTFIFLTALLTILGILIGIYIFNTFYAAILLGSILGMLLYLFLRWLLMGYKTKAIFELLPALEEFLQAYATTPSKNMKLALQKSIPSIRYPVRQSFEHLSMLLTLHENPKEALEIFTFRLSSKWTEQFASIVFVGLRGYDMTVALTDLIQDMRDAQEDNKRDRARLTEIRASNVFSVISFIALLMFNLELDVRWEVYYVNDPVGQKLFLFNIIFIIISVFLGIYVSRRKM